MAGSDHIIKRIAPIVESVNPRFLQRTAGANLILPFYHTIANNPLAHISHLYPVKNVAAFEQDLDFMLKYYQPIDLKELLRLQAHAETPTKPSFFLSFDDGLGEFYSEITPVLLRKGVPATCFLNSDFIDNKNLFFRYKVSLLIDHFISNPKAISKTLMQHKESNESSVEAMTSVLLSLKYSDIDMISKIADELEIDFEKFLKEKQPYLTSSQINELIGQGFTFGAHSVDHPAYRYISESEQKLQTSESMDSIANQFNLDYRVFSFPFTDHGVSKNIIDWMHHECGVQVSFGCAGQKMDMAENHYQRIAFENAEYSASKIHNAELAYTIIRKLLNKNTVSRA